MLRRAAASLLSGASRRRFSTDVAAAPAEAESRFVEAWKKASPNLEPPKTPSAFMKPRPPTPSALPSKLTVNFVLPYASQLAAKEHASGQKFQKILEEAIVRPLHLEGELYIGIPPGVESRLAALTVDTDDLSNISALANRPELPSSFEPQHIAQMATALPAVFNTLIVCRAIIPAANGHLSARALARYYAALADGGKIPPPHSSASKPLLGSHPHSPKLSSNQKTPQKRKCLGRKQPTVPSVSTNASYEDEEVGLGSNTNRESSSSDDASSSRIGNNLRTHVAGSKVYRNPRIIDEFLGSGEYKNLALPSGGFGLGFERYSSKDGSSVAFGHSGLGGSVGFCDVTNNFSIAVTLNKLSLGGVTGKIIHLVCSELNIPVPDVN